MGFRVKALHPNLPIARPPWVPVLVPTFCFQTTTTLPTLSRHRQCELCEQSKAALLQRSSWAPMSLSDTLVSSVLCAFCAHAFCWPCAELILYVQVSPGVPSRREAVYGRVLVAYLRPAHACQPRRSVGPGRCQLLLRHREPPGVAQAPACFDCFHGSLLLATSLARGPLFKADACEKTAEAEALADVLFIRQEVHEEQGHPQSARCSHHPGGLLRAHFLF